MKAAYLTIVRRTTLPIDRTHHRVIAHRLSNQKMGSNCNMDVVENIANTLKRSQYR